MPPNEQKKAPYDHLAADASATQVYSTRLAAQASAAIAELRARGVLRGILAMAKAQKSTGVDFSNESLRIVFLPGCRPCAICGRGVGNVNLGGYDGHSALSGELFCLTCADRGHKREKIVVANRRGNRS